MPETFSDGVSPRISDTERQKWGKLLVAYGGDLEPTDTVWLIKYKLLLAIGGTVPPPVTAPVIGGEAGDIIGGEAGDEIGAEG